jgi:hypothetical protein
MREIQEVYQRWLNGELSQEDTLFAIGDLLEKSTSGDDVGQLAGNQQAGRQAGGQKGRSFLK